MLLIVIRSILLDVAFNGEKKNKHRMKYKDIDCRIRFLRSYFMVL